MFLTILSRLGQGVIILFFLITITFFLGRMMPGDPLTDDKVLPAHIVEKNRAYYHLDEPVPVQYFYYLKNLSHGDLGGSMSNNGAPFTTSYATLFPYP